MSRTIRTILITTGVALIIGIGALIVFFPSGERDERGEQDQESFFSFLFGGDTTPARSPADPGLSTDDENEDDNGDIGTIAWQQLQQITNEPIAGAGISRSGDTTRIRFVARETGHIFQTEPDQARPRRISNTTVPGVVQTDWSASASSTLLTLRSEDGELSYLLASIETTDAQEENAEQLFVSFQDIFLPPDAHTVVLSPNGEQLFYLTDTDTGVEGVVREGISGNEQTVFSSPLSQWRAYWPQQSTVILSTKPAQGKSGVTYTVNAQTGRQQLVQAFAGTGPVTPFSDTRALISRRGVNASVITEENGSFSLGATLGTLADKCGWGVRGRFAWCGVPKTVIANEYPDAWYQGTVSFSDELWRIDTETDNTERLLDPQTVTGSELDVMNIAVGVSNDWLIFTNKNDLSLWALRLNE